MTAAIGHNTVAGEQLCAFVERLERLDEENRALGADRKEVFKEIKAAGLDADTIRRVLNARRLPAEEREQRDELFELYMHALEGPLLAHGRAREKVSAKNDAPPASVGEPEGEGATSPEGHDEEPGDTSGGEPVNGSGFVPDSGEDASPPASPSDDSFEIPPRLDRRNWVDGHPPPLRADAPLDLAF